MHEQGDTFGGYKLRQIEELLCRVARSVDRIGKKIDVLTSGMTPEEVKKLSAEIDKHAAIVTDASDVFTEAAKQLDKTGV